ncbi:MAG: hypothetical protein L7U48_05165, partial [Candidatus Poseidoniaceae archaeon]|nr:hypothetical protein [Candidatus Poseidoniaceae archaeon]
MPEAVSVLVLRGDGTALAMAEAEALGFQTKVRRGRLAIGHRPESLDSAAGIDTLLDEGGVMPWTTNEAVVAAVDIGTKPLEGKVCVRVDRLGGRMGDSSTQTIARSLGARLHEAGWD